MSEPYFSGYDSAVLESEALAEGARVPDFGGHELTFRHLEDRVFEVLAWRLKRAAVGPDRVRLMQGTGERGRDVVVYDEDRVDTIVQCKLLGSRMSKPDVVRELLKVALHDVLDPDVLGGGVVRYELWAPGGFTEPAEDIFREWPGRWDEQTVEQHFHTVQSGYAAFADLVWNDVREHVLSVFPTRLQPLAVGSHDVSVMVRDAPRVHEDFFAVNWTAPIQDVQAAIRDALSGGGIRHVGYEDVRYLLDRIESIAPDRRHGTGFGFLLGVPDPLLAAMTQSEFRTLLEGTMSAAYQTLNLLTGVVTRRVEELVFGDEHLSERIERRTALAVLRAVLTKGALRSLKRLTPTGEAGIDERFRVPEGLDLWGQIEHEASQWWDDLRAVIDTGEPLEADAVREDGMVSDAALRYRLYVHMQEEYSATGRDAFVRGVVGDLRAAADLVQGVAERVGGLIPEDVLVVSDLRLFDAPATTMTRFFDLYGAAPSDDLDEV